MQTDIVKCSHLEDKFPNRLSSNNMWKHINQVIYSNENQRHAEARTYVFIRSRTVNAVKLEQTAVPRLEEAVSVRVIDLQDEGYTRSQDRLTFILWERLKTLMALSQSEACAQSPLVSCKTQGYEDGF